jgi:hypothetical protein
LRLRRRPENSPAHRLRHRDAFGRAIQPSPSPSPSPLTNLTDKRNKAYAINGVQHIRVFLFPISLPPTPPRLCLPLSLFLSAPSLAAAVNCDASPSPCHCRPGPSTNRGAGGRAARKLAENCRAVKRYSNPRARSGNTRRPRRNGWFLPHLQNGTILNS